MSETMMHIEYPFDWHKHGYLHEPYSPRVDYVLESSINFNFTKAILELNGPTLEIFE